MDSDNLYFLIFFSVIVLALLIVIGAYVSSTTVSTPAGVLLLMTPDLNTKQILNQPFVMPGGITRENNVYIFYVYNPYGYRQNVTIDFYLMFNLNRSWVDVAYSTGSNFFINGTQTLECQVTAVLKTVTTDAEANVFIGAGSNILYLTVNAEVVK